MDERRSTIENALLAVDSVDGKVPYGATAFENRCEELCQNKRTARKMVGESTTFAELACLPKGTPNMDGVTYPFDACRVSFGGSQGNRNQEGTNAEAFWQVLGEDFDCSPKSGKCDLKPDASTRIMQKAITNIPEARITDLEPAFFMLGIKKDAFPINAQKAQDQCSVECSAERDDGCALCGEMTPMSVQMTRNRLQEMGYIACDTESDACWITPEFVSKKVGGDVFGKIKAELPTISDAIQWEKNTVRSFDVVLGGFLMASSASVLKDIIPPNHTIHARIAQHLMTDGKVRTDIAKKFHAGQQSQIVDMFRDIAKQSGVIVDADEFTKECKKRVGSEYCEFDPENVAKIATNLLRDRTVCDLRNTEKGTQCVARHAFLGIPSEREYEKTAQNIVKTWKDQHKFAYPYQYTREQLITDHSQTILNDSAVLLRDVESELERPLPSPQRNYLQYLIINQMNAEIDDMYDDALKADNQYIRETVEPKVRECFTKNEKLIGYALAQRDDTAAREVFLKVCSDAIGLYRGTNISAEGRFLSTETSNRVNDTVSMLITALALRSEIGSDDADLLPVSLADLAAKSAVTSKRKTHRKTGLR